MFTVDFGWVKVLKVVKMDGYDLRSVKVSLTLQQEEQVVLASLKKFKSNLITELGDGGMKWDDVCNNAMMISACNQIIRFYGD